MADNVKGLTIEIGASTSKFNKAMSDLTRSAKKVEGDLNRVNKALKLDPKNAQLVAQKQRLLGQAITENKTKLDAMKRAVSEYENRIAPLTAEEQAHYDRLQREIVETTHKLKELAQEQARFKLENSGWGKLTTTFNKVQPSIDKVANGFMKITKSALALGGALGALAVTKAFAKLEALGEVRSVFEGLGKSAEEITEIMDAVSNSVAGTKYGLADMAKVAKGALGGKADEKYGLDNYLSRIGDLAAFSGGSVDQFGLIMNKALSRGTVDARLLNQMLAGGIPIYNDLADSMGISVEEVKKMTSAGKIGFDELYKATEKYEGLATKTAMSTVGGALTILGQRWTNVGVAFLEGAYEPLKEGIVKIADWLKDNMDVVKEWGRAFGEAIKWLIEYARSGGQNMGELSDKAQKFVNVLKPAVAVVSSVVKWFMNLSAQGKKMVAFFLLATGPILKLTSGIMSLNNTIFNGVSAFASYRAGQQAVQSATGQTTSAMSNLKNAVSGSSKFLAVAPWLALATAIGTTLVASVYKHVKSLHEETDAMRQASEQAHNHVESATLEAETAQYYADKLDVLSKKENKSASDKQKIQKYVELLNNSVEGLNLTYDETTDALNMSSEAIQKNIDEMKESARAKAYMEEYEKAIQREIEAERKQSEQQEVVNQKQREYDTALRQASGGSQVAEQRLNKLTAELTTEKAKLNDTSTALKQAKADTDYFGNAMEQSATKTSTASTNIGQSVAGIASKVSSGLQSAVNSALAKGRQIPQSVGSGMTANKTGVDSGAGSVRNQILNGLKVDTTSVGVNAVAGIKQGMLSAKARALIANATATTASNVLNGLNGALKINSPSRLIRDTSGIGITEGLVAGMLDGKPLIDKAGAQLTSAVQNSLTTPTYSLNNNDTLTSAVATGMQMSQGGYPDKVNVVVELGGVKVGEKIVDLYDTTARALYAGA